jgi:hypothetical protein
MGAVADFVSDTFEAVGDFVGDVVETVGDVVEDVVDVVSDVVETVGDTVQAIIDDPLPVLVSIAGNFVGIPAPVTMAALTAARGGDLQDIVLSAGTAYFAPTVANSLSSTFAPALFEAVGNETVAKVVAESTSRALVSGTIAEVRGGDFEDAFAGAFTGSLVNSSVGEFTNEFVRPGVLELAEDNGVDIGFANSFLKGTTQAFSSGVAAELSGGDFETAFTNSVANQSINAGTNYATNSIGNEFRSISQAYNMDEDEEGFETTVNADRTGAGIDDYLVAEIDISELGYDTGDSTTALVNNTVAQNADDMLFAPDAEDAQTIAADMNMGDEPESSVTVSAAPSEFDFAEPQQIADEDTEMDDLFAEAPTNEVPSAGGLTAMTPEGDQITDEDITFAGGAPIATTDESIIDAMADTAVAAKPQEDVYAGLEMGITPMQEDAAIDVAGMDQKPTKGGLSSLVDTSKITPAAIGAGVLNQVVRPVIKQGLTKALARTPVRRPAPKRPPTRTAAPRQKPSPEQLQAMQARQARPAPAQKVAPQQVAKAVAPKKVDVNTLTPITNIAGLTSMLTKKTGQG